MSLDKAHLSAWKTLVILSSIATMVMYAETMLIPAIPDLIKDFSISYSTSSWILTTYLIAGAVMTPIVGKLGDMYGKKKMLLVIMIIYTTGVSLGGFATNIYSMLAVRALQGVGISMFPIAFGIIRDQLPVNKLAVGQGLITSMFAAGSVMGLLFGGNIIHQFGWQFTFFFTIPAAIALVIIIMRLIPESPIHVELGKKPSLDIMGAVVLAVTIISFLLSLTLVESDIHSPQLLVTVTVGVSSLLSFIIVEKKAVSPIINFNLLSNRNLLAANIMIMVVGMSMFMVFQTIPILVRNPSPFGFGGDSLDAAHTQLPFALVLLIFGPTSGLIISRLGILKPVLLGNVITTLGFFSLYFFHSNTLYVSANLAVLSVGLSLTGVGATNIILLLTPKQFSGASMGMSTLIRIIGSSVGPALAAMYMQTHQGTIKDLAGTFPTPESYSLIFLTAAIISISSIILTLIIRKRISQLSIV
ncbi:MAG: MFS transporter [Candidatus Nitrosotenuis sp.]|nr:MAG: MFS transporter [Candidatus Nitrosotenuis sp.]